MKKYFLAKNNALYSKLNSYTTYGSILGWDSFSLDDKDSEYLLSINSKINEIDKEIAVFGFRNFGDVRSEIKISELNYEENKTFDEEISLETYKVNSTKIKIPVTEKRYNCIISAMKLLAKLILEDIFEKRFLELDYNVSALEKKCWEYQLNGDENFIKSLAQVKNINSKDFESNIEQKKLEYEYKVKELYLTMVKLKQKFYDCSTIEELNVLFEDYMGLPMPNCQAIEEGRYIVVEGIDLPVRKEVIPGFKF